MNVLWLCNIMLPVIARELNVEASNKEGWISGLADVLLADSADNGVCLYVAFPAPDHLLGDRDVFEKKLCIKDTELTCYGFREDTSAPDRYDPSLEKSMKKIIDACAPDVVHCFGTEYPHVLAMCRVFPDKKRLLITIQGLCSVYANVYYADIPERVIKRATFRDRLKKDSIPEQQEKYKSRGEAEIEAVRLAGNVGGRTPWDEHYTKEWNPSVRYYRMCETLRSDFYEGEWKRESCENHAIFLSQGDYPIKGLHYMLLALPEILKKYPDTHVYVAGNSIVNYHTLKDRIKISSYGKYLRELIQAGGIGEKVTFLGKLDSALMKKQYLKSRLFVCPSAIENSPNSLAEAMILGMPCVAADVGGIPGMFTGGKDGVLYPGCRSSENSFDCEKPAAPGEELLRIRSAALTDAVFRMWEDPEQENIFCRNAREHAMKNHDRQENYRTTLQVYREIACEGGRG